jgi:hypothetical protein
VDGVAATSTISYAPIGAPRTAGPALYRLRVLSLKGVPPNVVAVLPLGFLVMGVLSGALALGGAVDLSTGLALCGICVVVSLTLFGLSMRENTREMDRHFAENAVRGVARVCYYAQVGPLSRRDGTGRLDLEIELELPTGFLARHRYWTWVPAIDVARLTTVGRFPCLATTEEPPRVRLYVRRDVADETLDGKFLTLQPR